MTNSLALGFILDLEVDAEDVEQVAAYTVGRGCELRKMKVIHIFI